MLPTMPPQRKRHRLRNTLLGVLIVLIGIVALATSKSPKVATTPTPAATGAAAGASASTAPSSTTATTLAKTATVGATLTVAGYRVRLDRVLASPALDSGISGSPGTRPVGVEFTLTAGSTAVSDDANNDATVVGNNNQTYTAGLPSIAGCTNFNAGQFTLTPGQSSTGCVEFDVPTPVHVVGVEWTANSSFGSTIQWKL